ncbi:hypothetical protein JKN35_005349 [Salmonella enterica]|nr:hypothetical protein [Salmonella enterica]ECE6505680.1 hypothetical protein [Salmonella enterica subsp. salamae]EEA8585340.1 hypothetical protein [Salmonella enterica subsp. enterica]EEE1090771.1 hypothetical protein [Salmonella enterica subsp. enterica serovar Beaudesert]EJX9719141.1 hypothetical protein [Salmonella bongori]
MNKTIQREINALHRIGVRCRDAATSFCIIPFVYSTGFDGEGKHLFYIDVLEWYATERERPYLMHEKSLFPDAWEELKLYIPIAGNDERWRWRCTWSFIRFILHDYADGSCMLALSKRELFKKAHSCVRSHIPGGTILWR